MPLRTSEIYRVADAILSCVCAASDEAAGQDPGYPGCPCRVYVAPGATVPHECGTHCGDACDGQLTVHLDSVRTSTTWPPGSSGRSSTQSTPPGCAPAPYTYAEYVVTLVRCVPVMDEMGTPPTVEELNLASAVQMTDAAVVHDALMCCVQGIAAPGRVLKYVVGPVRTVGPGGGCAGVEGRVTVALISCPCPEDGSIPDSPGA